MSRQPKPDGLHFGTHQKQDEDTLNFKLASDIANDIYRELVKARMKTPLPDLEIEPEDIPAHETQNLAQIRINADVDMSLPFTSTLDENGDLT